MNEVYLITNHINNKKYVGVTHRGYLKRYHEHISCAKSGRKSVLYDAMRKYGLQNFSVRLVESDIADKDIQSKEQYYIKQYNTLYINRNGYNMTAGGHGMAGYKHTAVTKQKISDKSKGRKFSSERNEKIRRAMIGRDYKEEWRKSLSESRKGRFSGKDNPFYGKKHSDISKQAIGVANTKHSVLQLDIKTHEVLKKFNNIPSASRWLIEHKYTSALVSTCSSRILVVCKSKNPNCTAYGFSWKYEEKSID